MRYSIGRRRILVLKKSETRDQRSEVRNYKNLRQRVEVRGKRLKTIGIEGREEGSKAYEQNPGES